MANIQFVDINDDPIGGGTKEEAYEGGIRRRVIRVFLQNSNGEVLMQRRGDAVSSGPGLWDDSVAGHVDEGEGWRDAAIREMKEELGVTGVELTEVAYFYKEDTVDPIGWKGFQRIYIGKYHGEINPDPVEVAETKWIHPKELDTWIAEEPEKFSKSCIRSYGLVRMLL